MAVFTNSALTRVLNLLKDDISSVAVGSNATAPTVGLTALRTETARKTPVSKTISGNTLTVVAFFDETEANGTLKEAGVVGSTTLIGAGAINVTKSNLQSLTITTNITVEAV